METSKTGNKISLLWISPWFLAVLTLMLGLLLSIKVAHIDADHRLSDEKSRVVTELATVRARLEAAVNSVFSATSGLVNVIAHQGEISPDLFNALASRAIKTHSHIRNIALAPNNTISMVYPLAGNERVIGLRYSAIPEQYKAVEQAMRTGVPFLSGPHKLVQGGEGFILRSPVFIGNGAPSGTAPRYWGVVSVVANVAEIMETGGVSSSTRLDVGLRQGEAGASPGKLIWGDESVFNQQPVSMAIAIPGGSWQIAAVRKGGWSRFSVLASTVFYLGLLNSILLAGLVWGLASRHHNIRKENRDLLREIEERNRAEEEMRLSEQKYLNIFNLMPDIVGITRLSDARFIEVNKGFEVWTGWSASEVIGRTSLELGLWDAETRARAVAIVREQGWLENFEFVMCNKSGEKRNALMYLTTINVAGEDCLYFMVHDITRLKQTQAVLENERLRFRNLVDSVDGIVWELDADTFNFTYVSQQAERLLGYPVAEWYQPGFWVDHLHPEDREWAPTFCVSRTAQHQDHDFEYRFIARDGSIFWLHDIVTVVEENGRPRWLRGIMVDTTGKKLEEAEKLKLETQLRQAQKMEAIGRLAGGVAHDFNNKLSVIMGYAEMAGRAGISSERYHGYLEQVIKAAGQSRDITRQLLAFSRQEVVSPRVIDLNDVVRDSQQGLCRFIGEDIRFETRLAEKLWLVNIDPSQVDQVIMNLVVNARDAMADGGLLTVETQNVIIDKAYTAEHSEVIAGDYVQLAVCDSGCGMDRETQQHIFEPFYTTKEVGKGTGLGLAMIYGIVTQNKGFVNVYSEPGIGTTFKIYFPRCEDPAHPVELVEAAMLPVQSVTVLLVEDDEMVRQVTTEVLGEIGCITLVAATAQDAIELCTASQGQIDLLLTDVVMPDMNGRDLSRRIAELRPGIKVLFMSGYTAEFIDQKGILAEDLHFIQKPFDTASLHRKIQSIMNNPAG